MVSISFDDGHMDTETGNYISGYKEFSVSPGHSVFFNNNNKAKLRAWHDKELYFDDDVRAYDKQLLTPEIEAELMKVASDIRALMEKAERLMSMPGEPYKVSEVGPEENRAVLV